MGGLWEHLVLDELWVTLGEEGLHYWRDKQQHEVDFVWNPRGHPPVAIECKWRAEHFDPAAFRAFLTLHPGAACWVVAQDRNTVIRRKKGALEIIECGIANLEELTTSHLSHTSAVTDRRYRR